MTVKERKRADVHRRPGEESTDLYPGLVVSDGDHSRVTGSITVGRSRLPLWAFIHLLPEDGWDATEDYYSEGYEEVFGKDDCAAFLHNLMQLRGEFGRLLLILANAERYHHQGGWQTTKKHRKAIADQLRRCLDAVDID